MNRRQLIASLLGLPFAKPAIVAAMTPEVLPLGGITFNEFVLDNLNSGAGVVCEKLPYSIPCFINDSFTHDSMRSNPWAL